MNCICLTTYNLDYDYLNFLNNFSSNLKIFVCYDNENILIDDYKKKYTNITFITILADNIQSKYYKKLDYIGFEKNIVSLDKSIYFFCEIYNENINKIIFFEEDVYFYSEDTINNLFKKYDDHDLICNSNYKEGKYNEWVWYKLNIPIPKPYFCGMCYCLMISNKMISCIKEYLKNYKTFFYKEAFFPTIAKYYKLKCCEVPEFTTLTYRGAFKIEDFNEINFYHPIKNIKHHNLIRNYSTKISILMPIYNGIEFLKESLPTILYQTYKNWELIIGINGHPPNSKTYQIAKKYENEKIKVLDLYTIKGKSKALNEMLKYTKYNWISLLDVDDKWLSKKLESQIKFISNYDVIGSMCKYFGDLQITPRLPVYNISQFNFLQFNPIINSSVLLRKELCFWDKNHDGVEDYDLWLRLWRQGKQFYNVPEIQVLHRIHKQSAFNAQGNNLKVEQLKQNYK